MKTTSEQIDDIINNRYRGRMFNSARELSYDVRAIMGDEIFLEYLKEQEITNPRPVYKIPDEFYRNMDKIEIDDYKKSQYVRMLNIVRYKSRPGDGIKPNRSLWSRFIHWINQY